MAEQVERFMGPISSDLQPEADGLWVRYSDYEKLEAERDQLERDWEIEYDRAGRALKAEAERDRAIRKRDEAAKQERQRIREATANAVHELALTIGRARVDLDGGHVALAKRELNGASEAMEWLRRSLYSGDSTPTDKGEGS